MSYKAEVQQVLSSIQSQDNSFFENSLPRDAVSAAGEKALGRFDSDVARLKQDTQILFASVTCPQVDTAGDHIATLFDRWRADPPSTVALIAVAADHFNIPADTPALKAALATGMAADVKCDNAYHDNSHFREVVSCMARLCNAHNEINCTGKPGATLLETDSIAKGLLAAAAHDLMHDGKGNGAGEAHKQYRLENIAIGAAEPFMKLAGMTEQDKEDVRVMVRVTDISGPKSPHKTLQAICAASREGKTAEGVPPELQALQRDPQLLTMATLMSDADLGPSTATNYTFSRRMTSLLSTETKGALPDSDKTLAGFIQYVVGGKLSSDAGQAASQKTLDGIASEAKSRIVPDTPAPKAPAAKQG